jgi:undecaprenyl-diphosphatase
MPSLLKILILAIVQGLAELLPVSSSAHVVVAEKLMGLDPSSPQMTLILVMLHTGTMFAVIVYFWPQWRDAYFRSIPDFKKFAKFVVLATALTGLIGEAIVKLIEKTFFRAIPHAQIEDLFGHLEIIAPALAAVGILILVAGLLENRKSLESPTALNDLNARQAGIIGAVQGAVSAISRISPLWRHNLCGHALGSGKITRGNVQFRSGGRSDAGCGCS